MGWLKVARRLAQKSVLGLVRKEDSERRTEGREDGVEVWGGGHGESRVTSRLVVQREARRGEVDGRRRGRENRGWADRAVVVCWVEIFVAKKERGVESSFSTLRPLAPS